MTKATIKATEAHRALAWYVGKTPVEAWNHENDPSFPTRMSLEEGLHLCEDPITGDFTLLEEMGYEKIVPISILEQRHHGYNSYWC